MGGKVSGARFNSFVPLILLLPRMSILSLLLFIWPSIGFFIPPRTVVSSKKIRMGMAVDHSTIVNMLDSVGYATRQVTNALEDATVPYNIDSVFSVSLAETTAGVIGGLGSRTIAVVLKDKKRDSNILKAIDTGAFFGIQSFARRGARLLGIPGPLATVLGSFLGAFVSEEIKIFGRYYNEHDNSMAGFNATMLIPADNTISYGEIASDIMKWLVFDASISQLRLTFPDDDYGRRFAYFTTGAFAGTIGTVVSFIYSNSKSPSPIVDPSNVITLGDEGGKESKMTLQKFLTKFCVSGLEGGVLFLTYQEFLKLAPLIIPDAVGTEEFLFKRALDTIQVLLVGTFSQMDEMLVNALT